MKLKSKIDPQLIIAFGVMIVSFSTLFVTMYQASIMNRQTEVLLTQTKANSWPCLRISKNEFGSLLAKRVDTYNFVLENKGTGPAIIKGIRVLYKNMPVISWDHLFKALQLPDSVHVTRTINKVTSGVISANEEITMIDVSDNFKLIDWMKKEGTNIKMEIYYQSVFGELWTIERWLTTTVSTYPKRVEKCPIPENEMFMD